MGIKIEQVDTPTAPESLLRELSDYYEIVEAEDMPGDPPTPTEARVAVWRQRDTHDPQIRWILRDDDGIAAVAVATYNVEQNLENGFGRIHVHPEKRGSGYARAIATPVLDHLEENGRTRLETWIKEGEPAEGLAREVGLQPVLREKRSRLVIADLDMDLMKSWVDRAIERAAEYVLAYHPLPMPDELVQKFCDLAFVMNTAPRDDFEEEDEVVTPEHWKEFEANLLAENSQLHTLIAVHEPTGDFAGYSQIKTEELHPDVAWQWDTGVVPSHRNKGLGRWLKADMVLRIVADYPKVRWIDTWNAGSNEPMLNINAAMGFKPVHISNTWQGNLVTVRKRFRA